MTVKKNILRIDVGASERRYEGADIEHQQLKTTGGVVSDKKRIPLLDVGGTTNDSNVRKPDPPKEESLRIVDLHDDESERFCQIVEDLDEEDQIEKELIQEELAR